MDLEQVQAKETALEKPLEAPKKRGPKKKVVAEKPSNVGNIVPDELKAPGDGDCVIFYLTDYGSVREGNTMKPETNDDNFPPRLHKRMTPDNFWRAFASAFTDDGRFINVKDAATVVRLFNNMTVKEIEPAIKFELSKTETAEQYDRVMDYYVAQFKVLKLNGSNQVIKKGDIIHCPGITDAYVFPKECLRSSKYGK